MFKYWHLGGSIVQWLSYLLPDPAARVRFSPLPEEKIVDFAEVNQRFCLGESGQWLENADRTH